MLKKVFGLTLILTPVIGVCQSKYDMGAALLVENYRQAATLGSGATSTADVKATLIVSVDGDATIDAIRRLGIEVKSVRNNVAIVTADVKDIDAMAQLPGVISIETGREQRPMMYFARTSGNAESVLDGSGSGLTQAYTGKGVVTGLMDQGIDPNHVVFRNADLTENRVKAVYTYMRTTSAARPTHHTSPPTPSPDSNVTTAAGPTAPTLPPSWPADTTEPATTVFQGASITARRCPTTDLQADRT